MYMYYYGKDWGQKEKRSSEDEMAGWHHWCNRDKFGQTSGDGEGQGGLARCSLWARKELDTTGPLNNNNVCIIMHNPWCWVMIFWLLSVKLITTTHCKKTLLSEVTMLSKGMDSNVWILLKQKKKRKEKTLIFIE